MSLDVYLETEQEVLEFPKIYTRENGQIREVSEEEFEEMFPGREPVKTTMQTTNRVFSANITHNLGNMANMAGVYKVLWHPEDVGVEKAKDLVEPLTTGLTRLRANPSFFKQFNPSNGWGSYDVLVEFVEEYLEACRMYPDATVRTWR